jgi:hypothetical protein
MMDISSIPITELTSAGILVFLLQEAKRIPGVGALGTWSYRIISIIWALVSTVIVSMEWNGNLTNGGSLILVLPGLGGALVAIWHFVSQYTLNEIVYQTTANRAPAPKAIPATNPVSAPEPVRSAGYLPPQATGAIPPGKHQ